MPRYRCKLFIETCSLSSCCRAGWIFQGGDGGTAPPADQYAAASGDTFHGEREAHNEKRDALRAKWTVDRRRVANAAKAPGSLLDANRAHLHAIGSFHAPIPGGEQAQASPPPPIPARYSLQQAVAFLALVQEPFLGDAAGCQARWPGGGAAVTADATCLKK